MHDFAVKHMTVMSHNLQFEKIFNKQIVKPNAVKFCNLLADTNSVFFFNSVHS